mmetsp:Transcript_26751/g.87767  ORF Transcript_26751/g.87767 Transcript_26751/m.87767 type:complete len:614 (+) Transcript_26751:102-1943(+)|eukprot:CAMPEP_0170135584 /NCGR_PEP_ID=MMETSP0033_2-20121228/2551_1 /TAXON_ID=195969 /ORGANISM="Dolichomastix tenuilepis, Strain CCMP3274" /LENGTH=613 /DNA_ID=CAMNT_0010371185 /DNA_START=83 /DNA_END=1924 /DNA_ORIENTATION=-
MKCVLDYPERFHACVVFTVSPPESAKGISEETRLLMYALYMQATKGSCAKEGGPKPWGVFASEIEKAQWEAWNGLGDMARDEAMRLYVSTVEEDNSDWWDLITDKGNAAMIAAVTAHAKRAAAEDLAREAVSVAEQAKKSGEKLNLKDDVKKLEDEVMRKLEQEKALKKRLDAEINALEDAKTRATQRKQKEIDMLKTRMSLTSSDSDGPKTEDDKKAELERMISVLEKQELVLSGKFPLLEALTQSNVWAAPTMQGLLPSKRSDHAAVFVDNSMYVLGGVMNGRATKDVFVLNLQLMEWSKLEPEPKVPGAVPQGVGYRAVEDRSKVLVVGGRDKSGDAHMNVYEFDTVANTWDVLATTGQMPPARSMHSATIVGRSLWVFGGESVPKRETLGDLYCLDLFSLEWTKPQTKGTPAKARSGHVAVAYQQYLLIHGGTLADDSCTDELCVLNTLSLQWETIAASGKNPGPRSGHAAALYKSKLYMCGGGDNTKALADVSYLELDSLDKGTVKWERVLDKPAPVAWEREQGKWQPGKPLAGGRCAVASEGLSLVAVEKEDALVTFGGNDGAFHNEVHVMKLVSAPAAAADGAAADAAAGMGAKKGSGLFSFFGSR